MSDITAIRKLINNNKLDQALISAKNLQSKHDFAWMLTLIGRGYVYRGEYSQPLPFMK